MSLDQRKKRVLAEIGLLICGAAWGGGFVVTKSVMESIAPSWTLALRFMPPALMMAGFFWRRLFAVDKRTFWTATVSGVIQFAGLIAQMIGLTMTTAGNGGFLTAIYVVAVPFIEWAVSKRRPGLPTFAAGLLCLIGVGVMALQSGLSINVGDAWVLGGGILFAVNIVFISACITGGMDAMVFTCIQFFFTALPAAVMGLFGDPLPSAALFLKTDILLGLFYIVFINTIFAQIVHNVALGHANPSHSTLLMSTEALFGCLFGILFLNEAFTLRFFAGAVLIAASIVISERAKNRHAARQRASGESGG